MRAIFAAGGIAAAVLLASAVCAEAQNAQLGLPEVGVTAPAPAPPRPRDSMISKWRVEEDKFVEQPCGMTRISTAAAGARCLVGYRLLPGMSGGMAIMACDMGLDVVMYNSGNLAVEADILSFDPYKMTAIGGVSKFCFINERDLGPDDFRDINQVTRRGDNFRNPTGNADGDQYIEFTIGRHQCMAMRRLGPQWRGGKVWVMHASICHTDVQPVSAADIAATTNALLMRIYDPIGNLRPPPK